MSLTLTPLSFRFVWEFWLFCGYFEAHAKDGAEMQIFPISLSLAMLAYFIVVLALQLPSGGTWEGGLKSQGILNKNVTGSATHCYLMEQAEISCVYYWK